jgi:hypothetical protein
MACPKDNKPPKPNNKLNAHANNAKHMTFIRKMGYTQMGAIAKNNTMMANATH